MTVPYLGGISTYTLVTGILAVVMGIYFLVNTSIYVRRLALLDGKRLGTETSQERRTTCWSVSQQIIKALILKPP